jgi:hypothetical protein
LCHRPSEVVEAAAMHMRSSPRPEVDTLILNTSRCMVVWLQTHACAEYDLREAAGGFLPWCLMRCVEAARELGFPDVVVVCDRTTWRQLSGTRLLARHVYPAIRITGSISAAITDAYRDVYRNHTKRNLSRQS